jgi:hypothetical protein
MQFSKVEMDVFMTSTFMALDEVDEKWVDGRPIREIAPEVYA